MPLARSIKEEFFFTVIVDENEKSIHNRCEKNSMYDDRERKSRAEKRNI